MRPSYLYNGNPYSHKMAFWNNSQQNFDASDWANINNSLKQNLQWEVGIGSDNGLWQAITITNDDPIYLVVGGMDNSNIQIFHTQQQYNAKW